MEEKQSEKIGQKLFFVSVLILKIDTTIVGLVFLISIVFIYFFESKILRPELISYVVYVSTYNCIQVLPAKQNNFGTLKYDFK